MNPDSSANKTDCRERFKSALSGLSPAQREEDAASARDLLRRQAPWQRAGGILFYAPMAGELDLLPLIEEATKAGKKVALPGFVKATGTYQAFEISDFGRDCGPGKFGVAEPRAHCPPFLLNRLDLALVPGLGFDLSGRRLGRGKGFYDRLLAGIAGAKCGVAYDLQVAAQIPADGHDVSMNFILTPTRWLEFPEQVAVQS